MTEKLAKTSVPILPVLAERWSPRSFDESYEMSKQEWTAILEAGRWSASANNFQPWRFSIAKRGSEMHAAIAAATSGFNQSWSPRAAGYLVVSVLRENADGVALTTARFDAGLAVSQMIIQAQSMGLSVHPMTGIDFPGVTAAAGVTEDLDVVVLLAVGKPAPADRLEGGAYDREIAPRVRLALEDLILKSEI